MINFPVSGFHKFSGSRARQSWVHIPALKFTLAQASRSITQECGFSAPARISSYGALEVLNEVPCRGPSSRQVSEEKVLLSLRERRFPQYFRPPGPPGSSLQDARWWRFLFPDGEKRICHVFRGYACSLFSLNQYDTTMCFCHLTPLFCVTPPKDMLNSYSRYA